MELRDLSFRDIEIFLLASKALSVREASRQSGLLPAHVSKIIKRVEEKLDQTLFRRSASGLSLTPEGLAFLEIADRIHEVSIAAGAGRNAIQSKEKLWTFASISFLTTYLLAPSAARWKQELRNVRFRLIEFSQPDLVAHGLKGAFEFALHLEPLEWTKTWESYSVGKLSWNLYAGRNHPIGPACREQDLLAYPFVIPADWSVRGYAIGEDQCPLPVRNRKQGDEAATADTALELCANSNQLTFVPDILAKNWLKSDRVRPIKVTDWPEVKKEIFLSVKADRVQQKLATHVAQSLRKTLL